MTIPTATEEMLQIAPYSLLRQEKEALMLCHLTDLNRRHYSACPTYRNLVDRVFRGEQNLSPEHITDLPFLPVSMFKKHELRSVPAEEIFKILTSSGTTSQTVSRIYLDRDTASLQSKALSKTMQHFMGKQRLPMVILDHPSVIKDRTSFSARGAGILGMAQYGRLPFYALDEDMNLDLDGLLSYLDAAKGSPVFFFGFTFMVWQFFVLAMEKIGVSVNLPDSILIHSGGWKKLVDSAVSPEEFRERVGRVSGIGRVINFYGMVEQVGSVFFENPLNYLHAPIFSDVIVRDPVSLKPVPDGEVGVLQVVSVLPHSYPGHSLLTEDLGVIRGVDHPDLDMKGRYFEVIGRIPRAEVRGCSDTFQTEEV